MISIEEMIGCIQEWYSQAYSFEMLEEIHFAVKKEAENQFLYMANVIAKEMNKEED